MGVVRDEAARGLAVVIADSPVAGGRIWWVPQALLEGAAESTPLGELALELGEPAIAHTALRYDLMEYFNGYIWDQQPVEVKNGLVPAAWPVVNEAQRILGVITYADAGSILTRESRYLRDG
ncbi:hypothetical protein [Rothia sp. ZJ932]|uniref:hypothetical protein n=1 Tax=Rothia sp. ZJ932 TaxID=2810516 RepID=UPI001967B478|nr:hypothetical protein [Rothia sp. ZJ932]QRZ60755.1 hypothetical protein JR346_05525 [Rothia sp. ZJ932]